MSELIFSFSIIYRGAVTGYDAQLLTQTSQVLSLLRWSHFGGVDVLEARVLCDIGAR